MRKMLNKKGFTLAELLIVIAIIAVLVAIAIPVFTAQTNKARQAVYEANARACYAEVVSNFMVDGADATAYSNVTKTFTIDTDQYEVECSDTTNYVTGWTVTVTPGSGHADAEGSPYSFGR